MRKFSRFFLVYFFSFALLIQAQTARAFVPLVPLLAGTAVTGFAPLETIAVGALVTGLALQFDQALNTSPQSVPSISVMLNPQTPLRTPVGWIAPVSSSPFPSPPLVSAPISSFCLMLNGWCAASTSATPQGACDYIKTGWPSNPSYTATAGFCETPGGWFSTHIQIYNIGVSCSAGYVLSGTVCQLSDSAQVLKPSTGTCEITRVGNTYAPDPLNPDCANPAALPALNALGAGGGMAVTAHDVVITAADGRRAVSVINSDGTTTVTISTPNLNASSPVTDTVTVQLSAPAADGSVAVVSRSVSSGGVPLNPPVVTPPVVGVTPAPTAPASSVADLLSTGGVDNTLPITDAPALAAARAAESADFHNNFNGLSLPALPAFKFPVFTPAACVAPSVTFQGKLISWDICSIVPTVKTVSGYILDLIAVALAFSMLMSFRAMRVRG